MCGHHKISCAKEASPRGHKPRICCRQGSTIMKDAESLAKEKLAPVQGYSAGIPWAMHLRAYDAYCKRYSAQPALIDLEGRNCRGGFGTKELDMFIPGWREELSEFHQLRNTPATTTALLSDCRRVLTEIYSDGKGREVFPTTLWGEPSALFNEITDLLQRLS